MIITDGLIGLSYFAISLLLWRIIVRNKVQFSFVVICFGVFIAACGATHFMEVWTLWNPDYWASAGVKFVTAVASVGTAIYLYRMRDSFVDLAALEMRMLFAAAPVGMLQSDPKTFKFTQVNRKICEMLGYTENEMLNMSISDITWPEDREADRARILSFVNGDREQMFVEKRYLRKDGSIMWGSVGVTMLRDAKMRPYKFITVIQDVTGEKIRQKQLEESELRYRTITDTLPQLVWTCTPDGHCDYLSRQWMDYTGLPKEDQLGLGWIYSAIHPEDRDHTMEHWMGAVRGRHPYDIDYRIRRHDGEYRWFKARATPVRNAHGEISHWFGTCTDIQDGRENRLRLEEAIRFRDEFLSMASHELKTPLTALKLQSQIAEREIKKGKVQAFDRAYVEKVVTQTERQVGRLTRLVDDMLDIGRIHAGQMSLHRENVDLHELVCDVVERMTPMFNGSAPGIESDPSVTGQWDRMRLEQVIINLLANSVKYGQEKPVTIQIRAMGDHVCLKVKDQGIGISPDAQNRIFDRFERAVDRNQVGGLGLGLYICKQIVLAHGGTITVESEIGSGSTFTVDLPRA